MNLTACKPGDVTISNNHNDYFRLNGITGEFYIHKELASDVSDHVTELVCHCGDQQVRSARARRGVWLAVMHCVVSCDALCG